MPRASDAELDRLDRLMTLAEICIFLARACLWFGIGSVLSTFLLLAGDGWPAVWPWPAVTLAAWLASQIIRKMGEHASSEARRLLDQIKSRPL